MPSGSPFCSSRTLGQHLLALPHGLTPTADGSALWLTDGTIADARVGLTAVGANTTDIPAISEALRGADPTEQTWRQAGEIAAQACDPAADGRGTVDYKRHLATELTARALRRSAQRLGVEASTPAT